MPKLSSTKTKKAIKATTKKPRAPRKKKVIQTLPPVTSRPPAFLYLKLIALNVIFFCIVGIVLWQVRGNEIRNVELPTVPDVVVSTSSSTPQRLLIPVIGLDTKVQMVGKTDAGKMAVPDNFTDVGWYKLGFYPGTPGNAVLAGHLDNGKGTPAVLSNLDKLTIGDRVFVLNTEGKKLEFEVIGMTLYDYDNAPLELIFGASTGVHLNIITCDGIWIPEKKIYDKRLVVFTNFVGIAE